MADESLEQRVSQMQTDLHEHLERYEEQLKLDGERWDKVIEGQTANNVAIHELTTAVGDLTTSTADIVGAWQAGAGVVKAAQIAGHVMKWLGGIAVALYAIHEFRILVM